MKLARLKQPEEESHKEDVKRLKNAFTSYGILMSDESLVGAWKIYSKSKEVEWAEVPEKDDDIYLAIIDNVDVIEW